MVVEVFEHSGITTVYKRLVGEERRRKNFLNADIQIQKEIQDQLPFRVLTMLCFLLLQFLPNVVHL